MNINKKFKSVSIIFIFFMMLFLGGCGAEKDIDIYNKDILEAVPEDKRLIIYTSHKKEVFEPVISEFEDRTGIWVELHTGGTIELMERIESSINNKGEVKTDADIMFGGGVESYEAFKDNFESYRCGDYRYIKPKFRDKDEIWTAFTELPIVFIYNKKLVSEENAPKRWTDFFENKWIGKISFADPLNSGSSCTALETLVKVTGNKDSINKFYKQLAGRISSGSGLVINEVDKGRALIGITLEETALKAIAAGEDIGIVYPEDGTSAFPDGCAIIKNSAHRENAELFMDFIISRDIQRLASEKLYRRSVRTDTEDSSKKNIKITDLSIENAVSEQKSIIEHWKKLLAEEE